MRRSVLVMLCAAIVFGSAAVTGGQTSRKSVPASEVNGTFRMSFKGKYRGTSNEIKIWALGRGRLKLAMDLIYPFTVNGELSANLGELDGEATIRGDTAIYSSNEFGPCEITIRFVKPGTIKVTQIGTDADCGFGHNVSADGTYRKVSGKKPKFEREQ